MRIRTHDGHPTSFTPRFHGWTRDVGADRYGFATAPGPASLWAMSPLGRLGVCYMPMPDRLIRTLTGGELALLTVIGSHVGDRVGRA